ncbi:MAG: hypothetical protein J6V53_06770 [Alphaproteobacteria bacterium]|nr:hypothetical protein [Alphaproteobacteria bacterium]
MYQLLNNQESEQLFSSFHQELKENAKLYVKNFCQSRSDVSKKDQNNLVKVIYDLLISSHLFNRNKMKTFSGIKEIFDAFNNNENIEEKAIKIKKEWDIYKDEIEDAIDYGLNLRDNVNPYYPACFNDTERVFFKIDEQGTLTSIFNQFMQKYNEILPDTHKMVLERLDKGQNNNSISAGRFLMQQIKAFERTKKQLSEFETKNLSTIVFEVNNQKEGAIQYQKDTSVAPKKKIKVNPFVFYVLKDKMSQLSKEDSLNDLITLLTNEINELSDTFKKYQFEAERDRKDFESKEEAPIDLIMFSKKAYDIANMSGYVDWWSCMEPVDDGCGEYGYMPSYIGRGAIVAYGYNSKNPYKAISRILLKPFYGANDSTHVFYNQDNIYGRFSFEFKDIVSKISEEVFDNRNENEPFYRQPHQFYSPTWRCAIQNTDVESWLDKYDINVEKRNTSLVIQESIILCDLKLKTLPNFSNYIVPHFYCYNNPLESLKNSPSVVSYNFNASLTLIKSLEGGPKWVGDEYNVDYCPELVTLKGLAKKVGSFSAENCKNLKRLEAENTIVKDSFCIVGAKNLKSLIGCPKKIGGDFSFSLTNLNMLDELPKVGGDILCHASKDFKIPKEGFALSNNNPKLQFMYPLFQQKGRIYNFFNLPENFVVKQNILINCDTEYGDELPDLSGVIIDGNISFEEEFKLSHWKWKPKKLTGYLNTEGITDTSSVPEELFSFTTDTSKGVLKDVASRNLKSKSGDLKKEKIATQQNKNQGYYISFSNQRNA